MFLGLIREGNDVESVPSPRFSEGYTYDPASQVTNILHQLTATSTQINKADYLYNGVGNRTSLTDKRGSQAFGYDSLDRLTSASHPLLGTSQAFAYDAVGNRTTGGGLVNAGNQLTADATHSYQYDDNGNLIRKTLLATGNYTQYTYDAENRLIKVEDFVAGNSTAAFTSTYRYDGLGRRIEKIANGQTRRYIYDGEDILLEYDGTNTLQARYTHGPGIDEPIAVTKGSSTFFYHQDGLGSVTDLTDSAGATAKSYAYDAYGTILESPGTLEQPYTYTGRELDSESGLYYYRARYYDAAIGRFLQQDPLGFANGDPNLYAYVEDNPLNFTDPDGKLPRPPKPPKPPQRKDPSPEGKNPSGQKSTPNPKPTCKLIIPQPPGALFNPCDKCWSCTYWCTGRGFVGGPPTVHRYQIGGCADLKGPGYVPGYEKPGDCAAAAGAGRKDNPFEGLYPGDVP
jgi:RHS repeat-associated protein